MYRKATDKEIGGAAAQIVKLVQWNDVKAYVERFYGPTVTTVELDYRSESDDQGGADYHIEGMECRDADDKRVDINFESDHWLAIAKDEMLRATTGRDAELAALRATHEADAAQQLAEKGRTWYDAAYIERQVSYRAESLDEIAAFWKKYAIAEPEDRAEMLEEHFDETISEELSAINFDHENLNFDLTTRPTVPEFYVFDATIDEVSA